MTVTYSKDEIGRLIASGRLDQAEKACREALASNQSDPNIYINLAHIAYQKRSVEEAIRHLESALSLDADNSSALHNLGVISDQAGDLEAAESYYRRAASADPRHVASRKNLASLLLEAGHVTESREAYAELIDRSPFDVDAHFAYSRLATYSEDDATLSSLQALTQRGRDLCVEEQIKISFTVGKANQDLQRFDDAFLAFRTGNQLHYSIHPYPESQNFALLEDVRTSIDSDFLSKHAESGADDSSPIFVLGMPRSGSTLIERILSGHSSIESAGEVKYLKQVIQEHLVGDRETIRNSYRDWTRASILECATAYLDRLRLHTGAASGIIDKMPGNYAFIGLIVSLLPNAKIVHTVRHPMATIWSNYSTHFGDALYYTYDLDVLTRYYRQYRKTMAHWKSVTPTRNIYDLHYEQLVANPEAVLQNLFRFLELPFEAGCLEFYKAPGRVTTASVAQVRQPLYTAAVDLWRNYSDKLTSVEAALHGA